MQPTFNGRAPRAHTGRAHLIHHLRIALNDIADEFPIDVRLFVYADDILLVARSDGECNTAAEILGRCITALPSGPFQLNSSRVHARIGFERVGYAFRLDPSTEAIRIEPDSRAMEKLRGRIASLVSVNANLKAPLQTGVRTAISRFSRHNRLADHTALAETMLAWAANRADVDPYLIEGAKR